MAGVRRTLALLSLALLPACTSDPSTVAEPPPTAPASAGPTASALPGLVVTSEELARDHRDGPLEYDTVPPVGGPHNPRWIACDVYDEAVPEELAVHALEHGAVWFAYAPGTPQAQVDRLSELAARNREYVLVSPVAGTDAAITAVAWGVRLPVDSADDPRLVQFLEQYAGGAQGGEPGAPCRGGGATLREARGLVGGGTST